MCVIIQVMLIIIFKKINNIDTNSDELDTTNTTAG